MKLHLFDIEGTIAPITFVHDVLFPYSVKKIEAFLEANPDEINEITKFLAQCESKYRPSFEYTNDSNGIAAVLKWWIAQDFKMTPLKSIQGKIWKAGFEGGEIIGELYRDATDYFARINTNDKLGIYSSGAIMAQKLLLKYNNYGPLEDRFIVHFDTQNAGPKRVTTSYKRIKEVTDINDIVFYTDIIEEACAASDAGLDVVVLVRPCNKPIDTKQLAEHRHVASFDEI